ncbi:MAG TPA: hypothetical protein VGG72_30420 [Bryobacteraceae bacterium]|jgi:hypothetical protein
MPIIGRFVTRRRFAGQCVAWAAAPLLQRAAKAQARLTVPDPTREQPIKFVREFTNAYTVAVSPDGERICLYFTRHPHVTFTFHNGKWVGADAAAHDRLLGVMELDGWKGRYSTQLLEVPAGASFFADGDRLHVETQLIPISFKTRQEAIVDLRTDSLQNRIRTYDRTIYSALENNTLLGFSYDEKSRGIALFRAELPDYQETLRVPFAAHSDAKDLRLRSLVLTADRKVFAYGFDHTIVCRRTGGLDVIWTRQVAPELPYGIGRLAISADGSRAAAAVVDMTFLDTQKQFYVEVYAGRDGATIARLPVNGYQALALSPRGDLLAVGTRVPDTRTRDILLGLEVYKVETGRMIGSALHSRIPQGRFQNLDASFAVHGVEFLSGGRFVVTSDNSAVRVWDLGRG